MSDGFPRQATPLNVLVGVGIALPIAIAAGVIAWSAAHDIEILSGESVDLEIVQGFRQSMLRGGAPIDPTQTRLPMMACALAADEFGWDGLAGARFVSVLTGVAAILVAAALASLLFDAWTGALAALLLCLSPYFLSFMRIAMTEGDVCAALTVTLAVLAYVWYLRSPTAPRWTAAAVALALAIGAKLLCIFLIPAFAIISATTYSEPVIRFSRDPRDAKRLGKWLAALWMIIGATFLLALAGEYPPVVAGADWIGGLARGLATAGWFLLLVSWIGAITFAVMRGVVASSRSQRFRQFVLFAGAGVFVLMPVHVLAPDLITSVVARAIHWDGHLPLSRFLDHVRLYSGILLIKATIPIGVVTILAMCNGLVAERSEARWRPCLFVAMVYMLLLCFLPLRQTFYLMPVYPCLMILAAAMAVATVRWAFSLGMGYGTLACALVAVGVGNLALDCKRVHPDYQLYGYSTVGDRWLGAESRGARNLIQTPSDGVVSLIHWCNTSPTVQEGDRILSYLWDDRIVREVLDPDRSFQFFSRGVTDPTGDIPPPPLSITEADFVVLHLNNIIGYADRPPDHPPLDLLSKHFLKVFCVTRGPASGPLEVGWVFERKR